MSFLGKMVVFLTESGVFRGVSAGWKWYLQLLSKHPLRAQMLNTGVLMGTGDIISQVCLERKSWKNYDKYRTLRFIGVGLFVLGPPMHYWYDIALNRFFPINSLKTSVKKMMCDQAFFLPAYCATFIASMGFLRGEKQSEITEKLHRDLGPILLTSWQLWIPVQVANFHLIPVQHRILVINLVGLMWNTYVSWRAERKEEVAHKRAVSLWREAYTSVEHWDIHEVYHDRTTPFH